MNYNIGKEVYVEVNEDVGNTSLDFDSVQDILNVVGSGTLVGDNILCLDFNLGVRVKLDSARYYFESASASGTVLPTIEVLSKRDYVDSYTSETVSIGGGYYYTTFSGVSSPRYVRLKHDLTGVAFTGTVVGFEIYNDDTIVDFGETGALASLNIYAPINEGSISSSHVFNSGDSSANAYIRLEPTGTAIDDEVFLSNSYSGPWRGLKAYPLALPENTNQTSFYNHPEYSKRGKIENGKFKPYAGYTEGVFTSPIFKLEGDRFTSLNIVSNLPPGTRIAVDEDDVTPTIEVRNCQHEPSIYGYYRGWWMTNNALAGDSYWLETAAVKKRGFFGMGAGVAGTSARMMFETIDNNNEYTYMLYMRINYSYSYDQIVFRRHEVNSSNDDINYLNSARAVTISEGTNISSFVPYSVLPTQNKGCWLYFYANGATIGTGYHLLYYSDLGTLLYNSGAQASKYIYDVDVVYSTGEVWYTDVVTEAVYKLSNTGITRKQILISDLLGYDTTVDLRGLCVTSDGGCWFINGNNIYRLDADGVLVDTLEDMSRFNNLKMIALDGDNGLWVIDDAYVRNISIETKSINFDVLLEQPRQFRPTGDTHGILVHCEDNYNKYIDKATQSVLSSRLLSQSVPGPFCTSYDNPNFSGRTYLTDDILYTGSISATNTDSGDFSPWYAVNRTQNKHWQVDWYKTGYWYCTLPADVFFVYKYLWFTVYAGTFTFSVSNNGTDWTEIYAASSIYSGDSIYKIDFKENVGGFRYMKAVAYVSGSAKIYEIGLFGLSPYFPHELDTNWATSAWRKVSLSDFNFSATEYNQVRVTLRRDSSSLAPELDGVYLNKSVSLGQVDPGESKEFFVKIEAPNESEEYTGSHSSNIVAWWDIPG